MLVCPLDEMRFNAPIVVAFVPYIAELKPTFFVSVPRLFNRIYDKVFAGVKAKGGLAEFLFNVSTSAAPTSLSMWSLPMVFSPSWPISPRRLGWPLVISKIGFGSKEDTALSTKVHLFWFI